MALVNRTLSHFHIFGLFLLLLVTFVSCNNNNQNNEWENEEIFEDEEKINAILQRENEKTDGHFVPGVTNNNDELLTEPKEKGFRDDSADIEVILGSGPMISPDIIIEKFSDSKVNVHDRIIEAGLKLLGTTSSTPSSSTSQQATDKNDSDDDLDQNSSSWDSAEGDDNIFDNDIEGSESGHSAGGQAEEFLRVRKPKNGAACHAKMNGTSGSFEMDFEDDCTILIGTPTESSRLILHCENMKLPNCSVNREAITVNLKGDLKFGRNSFFYCGQSQIRTTSLRRRIAIRIKRTPQVNGQVKCHFFSRQQRLINLKADTGVGFGTHCGRLGRSSKIVGGQKVPPGLFPWVAQLDITRVDGSQTACTGSLISERFVVSAAHCLKNAESISVFLGGADRLEFIGTEVTVQADKYILHRKWNPKTLTADLALVQLSEPVKFTEEISPICLQEPESLFGLGLIRRESWQGKTAVAVGWGRLTTKETAPRRLYRVKLPFLDDKKCQSAYSIYFQKRSMVCTASTTEAAICYGDSGGPLMYKKKDIVYQVGVASFSLSRKCGESPDVFTKISEYAAWIKTRVRIDS